MLDLIGAALRERGLIFQRIDGQSSLSQRKEALEKFGGDPLSNIMLASIGAAGEGYVSISLVESILTISLELTSLSQIRFTLLSLIGIPWRKPKR
jgi:hypothetical protein